jgi:cytidylate kinase
LSVITVSRQYASGGSRIAELAAGELGWTVVDNEFIDRVAARVGLPPEEVAHREERVPGLIERLARTLTVSSPELFLASSNLPSETTIPEVEMVQMTEAVINEAAQHGNVVLVGRGAQAHLTRREGGPPDDVLFVYIVAPREVRVQRVMEILGASHKEAEKTLGEIDAGRRDYLETHYRQRWDDPTNYHLVLNTGLLSYEEAASVLVAAARRQGW